MSSIATKPSARLTTVAGASPATILQKMQSASGSDDPFLRDGRSADSDEGADRRVDEPGRVIVAVAATRTIDQYEVLAPDLLAPAPSACRIGLRPQPRSSLALDRLRHRVGPGGPRPRPRRVREDVHLRQARSRD